MNVTPIDPLDRLSATFKSDVNRLFSEQIPALSAELRAIIESGSFGTELLGFRNKIIGDFSVNQRGLTSVSDDAYCCDRWYALTETGSVTVGQVTDPEQGAPWAWKLTQPDAVAKRIGLATIIESKNIRAYRGQAMNLSMRVKPSFSGAVRYAIIEHTGTADVVTSDVVNNWSSAVFTAGNFFIAGLDIVKTGVVTPGANLYDWIDDHGIFGTSLNNAILFVWSESAQIQGATLELNRPQFEPGIIKTPHEWRNDEESLCQRYLPFIPAYAEIVTIVASSTLAIAEAGFQVSPRVAPTGITTSSMAYFAANNYSGGGAGTPVSVSFSTASKYNCRIGVTTTADSPTQSAGNVGYLSVGTSGFIRFDGCEL